MPSKTQPDERATEIAGDIISGLRRRYGVGFPIRTPAVYTIETSRLAELLRFLIRDFLLWPIALRCPEPPALGAYDAGIPGETPVILVPRGDISTLEHEVRHHFAFELRRRIYAENPALDFLRDYYWSGKHRAIARRKLLRDGDESPAPFEALAEGRFPESEHLPEAVACVIAEASPWVSEGFAAEGSFIDAARAPLKLVLGFSAAALLNALARLLPSLPLLHAMGIAYLMGGVVSIAYRFLRTLPLDLGVLRWRWMRRSVDDADVAKLLAFPPGHGRSAAEILSKLEEYGWRGHLR